MNLGGHEDPLDDRWVWVTFYGADVTQMINVWEPFEPPF